MDAAERRSLAEGRWSLTGTGGVRRDSSPHRPLRGDDARRGAAAIQQPAVRAAAAPGTPTPTRAAGGAGADHARDSRIPHPHTREREPEREAGLELGQHVEERGTRGVRPRAHRAHRAARRPGTMSQRHVGEASARVQERLVALGQVVKPGHENGVTAVSMGTGATRRAFSRAPGRSALLGKWGSAAAATCQAL